mmetsp:Transcript_15779/g.43492  ORF Transcript_15779/g.43492 Transcript_15779/m.43492 type:complete len:285 (+) Transcript_15779:129-983(+)
MATTPAMPESMLSKMRVTSSRTTFPTCATPNCFAKSSNLMSAMGTTRPCPSTLSTCTVIRLRQMRWSMTFSFSPSLSLVSRPILSCSCTVLFTAEEASASTPNRAWPCSCSLPCNLSTNFVRLDVVNESFSKLKAQPFASTESTSTSRGLPQEPHADFTALPTSTTTESLSMLAKFLALKPSTLPTAKSWTSTAKVPELSARDSWPRETGTPSAWVPTSPIALTSRCLIRGQAASTNGPAATAARHKEPSKHTVVLAMATVAGAPKAPLKGGTGTQMNWRAGNS